MNSFVDLKFQSALICKYYLQYFIAYFYTNSLNELNFIKNLHSAAHSKGFTDNSTQMVLLLFNLKFVICSRLAFPLHPLLFIELDVNSIRDSGGFISANLIFFHHYEVLRGEQSTKEDTEVSFFSSLSVHIERERGFIEPSVNRTARENPK